MSPIVVNVSVYSKVILNRFHTKRNKIYSTKSSLLLLLNKLLFQSLLVTLLKTKDFRTSIARVISGKLF